MASADEILGSLETALDAPPAPTPPPSPAPEPTSLPATASAPASKKEISVTEETEYITSGTFVTGVKEEVSAPVSKEEVPVTEETDYITFGTFGTGVSEEVSPSTTLPPAPASAPDDVTPASRDEASPATTPLAAKKKWNVKRAMAKKKAFGSRGAVGDEATESIHVPASASFTQPCLKKFRRTRNRRNFGRRLRRNTHRGVRGWRGLGLRNK